MAKIRVLVVEDSLTVRQRLCEILAADPELDVVGQAADGKRAIEACRELRPDIITLDMIMPTMSGVAATEYIMAHFPTPILIVSASTNRGELFKTYDALAAGAVDVLEKPRGNEVSDEWERRFVATVKLVSRIKVITHLRARLSSGQSDPLQRPEPISVPPSASSPGGRARRILAVGASTGGPGALVEVFRGIPEGFPLPMLVVLHIDEPFGAAFADWLDAQIPHSVSYAKDGEPILGATGRVIMATPGYHLVTRGGRFHLTSDPERHSCRPSIDVLFESVAAEYGATAIAALLTGMGRDGATGLLQMRRAGGATIAQDEATSVVYGMPREARLIGAAERILPLAEIGPAMADLVRAPGGIGR